MLPEFAHELCAFTYFYTLLPVPDLALRRHRPYLPAHRATSRLNPKPHEDSRMKNRNLILAALLAGNLATVGYVTVSHAGPKCGDLYGIRGERTGHVEGGHGPLKRLMRHVDLSDAQQTEIKIIIETSRTGTESVRHQLRDSRKAMYSMVTGSDYSLERVRELAAQQAKLDEQLTIARIDTMHRALQVLTPEQRAVLAKLREQRVEKKKPWMDDHKND